MASTLLSVPWWRPAFKTFSRSLCAYTGGKVEVQRKRDNRLEKVSCFVSFWLSVWYAVASAIPASTTHNPSFFLFLCGLSREVWCLFKRRRLHVFLCLLIKKQPPLKAPLGNDLHSCCHWMTGGTGNNREPQRERAWEREKERRKERKGFNFNLTSIFSWG